MSWIAKSEHQCRVEEFMYGANQTVPLGPTLPDKETRILRARLILEEALETIEALGIRLECVNDHAEMQHFLFHTDYDPDLIKIADGCADLSVVTTGTLSAIGVSDKSLLEEVDDNNLYKIREPRMWDSSGKLIKPSDHEPPDINRILRHQIIASNARIDHLSLEMDAVQ